MATLIASGYKSPGAPFAVAYVTAPVDSDTLVVNGVRQTILEWKRRGVLTVTNINTTGKTITFYPYANPEQVASAANGSSISSNS